MVQDLPSERVSKEIDCKYFQSLYKDLLLEYDGLEGDLLCKAFELAYLCPEKECQTFINETKLMLLSNQKIPYYT